MIKELRKVKNRSVRNYIHKLQAEGKIQPHINQYGYKCYDTAEYGEYKKRTHRGRPCKQIKGEGSK